ncbi:hypothetical protein SMALB_5296 [Streptomyces malaysiensis]|uniref:Uncharacterized protein n=1 Tax=Streptomyces malaysiensis TaxID=92644 RepID=A0A7X5X5X6_STRMQ|nr:hypothetical protein [Streptomyces malaysiensis]
MLASTVQFSNNDQSSTNPHGLRHIEGSFPQTPNSVPGTLNPPQSHSTPKQY